MKYDIKKALEVIGTSICYKNSVEIDTFERDTLIKRVIGSIFEKRPIMRTRRHPGRRHDGDDWAHKEKLLTDEGIIFWNFSENIFDLHCNIVPSPLLIERYGYFYLTIFSESRLCALWRVFNWLRIFSGFAEQLH